MDTAELAKRARELRRAANLTQGQLRDRLIKAGYAESLSVQAISMAENPATESDMNKLRVAIIEHLTGGRVVGPVWYLDTAA